MLNDLNVSKVSTHFFFILSVTSNSEFLQNSKDSTLSNSYSHIYVYKCVCVYTHTYKLEIFAILYINTALKHPYFMCLSLFASSFLLSFYIFLDSGGCFLSFLRILLLPASRCFRKAFTCIIFKRQFVHPSLSPCDTFFHDSCRISHPAQVTAYSKF